MLATLLAEARPEQARWSHLEMLLADVVDELRNLQWVYVAAHSDRKPPPQPAMVRRPGVQAAKPRPRLSEASAEHLFRVIQGGDEGVTADNG